MDMNKNIVADVIWFDFEPYIYRERLCTDGELRAELRERRREESRLSVRLEQLESSVYDRMQKLHTVLRQTHDVALQQELHQLMADSQYAERRASSREGGSEARRFRRDPHRILQEFENSYEACCRQWPQVCCLSHD
eukprot:symbB.v1.2.017386.t1/scaffold1357.1/size159079/4